MPTMLNRPRRLRVNPSLRELCQENQIQTCDLIAPLFLVDGKKVQQEISSMPGQYRFSSDMLMPEIDSLLGLGVKAISLFPAVEDKFKDSKGSYCLNQENFYLQTISKIKQQYPEMLVMADVALDPYSSDGHDGIVDAKSGEILNDESIELLVKMALLEAQAGADILGPSDMMDGRIGLIRQALESEGLKNTLIMSYSAKYASSFYGPFRDALDSAPKKGDKKSYQMNPANISEALKELELDLEEGADIVMVKPGLPYLDVVQAFKQNCHLPVAVYNVSGEYAMIKAAAQKGWLDEQKSMAEMLLCFKRAGADLILTYFAKDMAKLLRG